nr:unnamed protein product [Digitaria exilis]
MSSSAAGEVLTVEAGAGVLNEGTHPVVVTDAPPAIVAAAPPAVVATAPPDASRYYAAVPVALSSPPPAPPSLDPCMAEGIDGIWIHGEGDQDVRHEGGRGFKAVWFPQRGSGGGVCP